LILSKFTGDGEAPPNIVLWDLGEPVSSWWYISNGKRRGPVSPDELQRLLNEGTVTATSPLWKTGMKEWLPAAQIDEVVPLLKSLPPDIPPVYQQKSSSGPWRKVRRHLGSTIALILGCLAVIGGLARLGQAPDGGTSSSVAGAVMILGALAYRSAKKRKLGEVKATLTRQFLEIVLLVLICLGILMQNNLKILIATDPIPNFVIPVWAVVAYLIIAFIPSTSFKSGGAQGPIR
jgi:uncharacterized protein DUF4339